MIGAGKEMRREEPEEQRNAELREAEIRIGNAKRGRELELRQTAMNGDGIGKL